ncbi:MAG: carbon-nitrogen hydrolase family protein [Thermoplasmatota archaeon]
MVKLAVVQAEPVILDAQASLEKAARLIAEAAAQGARLCLFPEAFVPAYAHWAHAARFEHPDHQRLHARLVRESVRVPEDLGVIAAAAKEHGIVVALPVTERDPDTPGTPYITMAVFDRDGTYLGKHRKLTPTHHERTVYGYGGGEGLRAFEVTLDDKRVRMGGLLCWNNFMPLARAALYQQGIQLYLAPTADDRDPEWQEAMRFIAREGRCFVLASCLLQRKTSFPDDFELAGHPEWQAEPEWNERGGSSIVDPWGKERAGPVFEEATILVADVDLDETLAARQTFDAAGHYGRMDVLKLHVEGLDRTPPHSR